MLRRMAAASLVFSCGAIAQTEFEAVSIKPNKSGEMAGGLRAMPGGRVNGMNVPVKVLIAWAYQVRESQISGEPGWVDSERFDVLTNSDGNPRTDYGHPELQTMFRSVLADRFKLSFHRDAKEQAVLLLRTAKNGPKIRPVEEGDCTDNPPPANPCHSLRMTKFAHIEGSRADLRGLSMLLAGFAGKIVLDKTDLKGSFSFTLDWTKYLQPPQMPPGVDPPPGAFDPMSVEPAISAALEEQLGLKLESGKGPVEILVIDHVERPSEN
jgi:uncharacterized protein (TIGR03435 family)